MSVLLKQGVRGYKEISHIMRKAVGRLHDLYASKYLDLVITSIMDGTHRADSLHYHGEAIDIRTQGMTREELRTALSPLTTQYGGRFDIVMHSTHTHVEYDIL